MSDQKAMQFFELEPATPSLLYSFFLREFTLRYNDTLEEDLGQRVLIVVAVRLHGFITEIKIDPHDWILLRIEKTGAIRMALSDGRVL